MKGLSGGIFFIWDFIGFVAYCLLVILAHALAFIKSIFLLVTIGRKIDVDTLKVSKTDFIKMKDSSNESREARYMALSLILALISLISLTLMMVSDRHFSLTQELPFFSYL